MQETVTTAPERKSLLSSFLDVLEAQNKTATAERQLQEERYRRRAQRIYDYHAARGGGAAALPGLRVAARARAGGGAAGRGVGRRGRGGGGRAAERGAGAPGGHAAALHGAVRGQRRADPCAARRHAPAADGPDARQDGGGAAVVDGVPAPRRGRHLQHRDRHRQPAQHDSRAAALRARGVVEQRVHVAVRRGGRDTGGGGRGSGRRGGGGGGGGGGRGGGPHAALAAGAPPALVLQHAHPRLAREGRRFPARRC